MLTTPALRSLLALLVIPTALATPLSRRQEDPQKSLTLDPANVMKGLEQDGQGADVEPGQVRSLTSSNNFINFCLTQPVPITDGKQIDGGSCNPAPIGRIAAKNKMPASKFFNPPNFSDTVVEDEPFDIKMKIQNIRTGLFVNPNTNYYAMPQTVDDDGIIKGHTHFTIQRMPRDDIRTVITINPQDFVFFKGINQPADNDGVLTQPVTDGLKAGNYRLCSINASMSHAPVLVAIAQHGSLDDCIYFTVRPKGGNGNGNNGNNVQDVGGDADTGGDDPSKDAPVTQAPPPPAAEASATESGDAGVIVASSSSASSATETSAAPPAETSAAQGNGNQNGNQGNQTGNQGNQNGNQNGNQGNQNGKNNRVKLPPFLQDLINQILRQGKNFFQKFQQKNN